MSPPSVVSRAYRALNGALRIRGERKCTQGPDPQPLDPSLLGSGDNHVERHVPSPRSGSGTA